MKPGGNEARTTKDPVHEMTGYDLQFDLLGLTIRNARREKQLNQKELGRLAGVGKSQIVKIENQLAIARFDSIIKVFKALNVKMNFFIELPDQTVTFR